MGQKKIMKDEKDKRLILVTKRSLDEPIKQAIANLNLKKKNETNK